MTAAVQLDLTQTLCRYAIDPASGALKLNPARRRAQLRPGRHAAGQPAALDGRPDRARPRWHPTLPGNIVGQVPVPDARPAAWRACRQIPGVTK